MPLKKIISLAALIATITSNSAVAEGAYLAIGVAAVNAEEPGYEYGSTNAIGMIGYEINNYLSIEGEFSFVAKKGEVLIGSTTAKYGGEHLGVYAKFTLPTSVPINPYIRLGMIKGEGSVKVGSVTLTIDDTEMAYGIGAEWKTSEKSGIRLDYTVADFGVTEASVLSISHAYNF